MGGRSIDDEQRAFTCPFTQAQWQELVFCAPAKPAVKTSKKNTKRLIFVLVPLHCSSSAATVTFPVETVSFRSQGL
jgi:hypothetical protein